MFVVIQSNQCTCIFDLCESLCLESQEKSLEGSIGAGITLCWSSEVTCSSEVSVILKTNN